MIAEPEPGAGRIVISTKAASFALGLAAYRRDARLNRTLKGGICLWYGRISDRAETPARERRGANQPNRRRGASREAA
jgi:hypothetical protein